jgi:molecular chaperone GrpE
MMNQQDSDEASTRPGPESTGQQDTAGPEQALAEAQQKAEEYLANWQRAQADFINYKRRIEQEREEFSKYACSQLMLSLLPILDDLDRALDAAPHSKSARHGWLEGIRLVDRKLRTTLEAQGLTPIKAVGEPFDPNFHEAVRQDKGKEGIVTQEFQKGYMMYDKLLRPSRVVVGNGEEDVKEDK